MQIKVEMVFYSVQEMIDHFRSPGVHSTATDLESGWELTIPSEKSDDTLKPSVDAVPSAIKLAEEHGIDLATVEGTGKDGRILKRDVQAAMQPHPDEDEDDTESPEKEEPAESEQDLTLDEMREKIRQLHALGGPNGGPAAVLTLLKSHGALTLRELDRDSYPAVAKAIDALVDRDGESDEPQ